MMLHPPCLELELSARNGVGLVTNPHRYSVLLSIYIYIIPAVTASWTRGHGESPLAPAARLRRPSRMMCGATIASTAPAPD